jgi:FPC/CPF motif-containing protein YcgG
MDTITQDTTSAAMDADLRTFIANPQFPCVGAKSASATGRLQVVSAHDIGRDCDDVAIHQALQAWVERYRANPEGLRSLAIVFGRAAPTSEATFERAMWARLQSLAQIDAARGYPYDPLVSRDPGDADFAVSFAGAAFFIVGLHPGASRPARRFAHPAMVFNLHAQFERLREQGLYGRMRDTIIKRDTQLAGHANPMLSQHGERSAARQYSGRAVGEAWTCPFRDPRA